MLVDYEHWDELQTLFDLADTTLPQDRERVLAQACPDPALRSRALDLVRESERPANSGYGRDEKYAGPYRILSLIGSGGMGSVYLAERTVGAAVQRVAVKMLAPHAAGPDFVDRFAREQQILAGLDHPGITRLLDAGLNEAGEPYLVMEYVEGVHLDRYCHDNRLDLRTRLALFRKICEILEYSHRSLVVHLDLKPSNILVNPAGAVKLLDFGTAKLLQPDGTYTATILATPAYASPEQLSNRPPTTASDVYSLGVILFELLTGQHPCGERRAASLTDKVTPEAAAVRRTTQSRLRALLSGDLTTIVLKCLEESAEDRYPAVDALSADIGRYLENRPILARPQTALYRGVKFVRRNRGKVAVAALLLLFLTGSLTYGWLQQRRALLEAQRAVRMQKFMSMLFEEANPDTIGRPEPTVKELLEKGASLLPQQLTDPVDLREAQLAIGQSLSWQNDLTPAKSLYAQALASAESSHDTAAEAVAYENLANIALKEGRNGEAKSNIQRAFDFSPAPDLAAAERLQIARLYVRINNDLGTQGIDFRRILRKAIQQARDEGVDPATVAQAFTNLGNQELNAGDLNASEKAYQKSLNYAHRPPVDECSADAIVAELGLASVRTAQNRPQEAVDLLAGSYARRLKCIGYNYYTQNHEARLASAMVAAGRVAEGLAILEKAEPAWLKPPIQNSLAYSNLSYLAHAYVEAGRFEDAERVCVLAHEMFGKQLPEANKRRGGEELNWARALAGEGHYQDALAHAQLAARAYSQPATPLERTIAEQARSVITNMQQKLSAP